MIRSWVWQQRSTTLWGRKVWGSWRAIWCCFCESSIDNNLRSLGLDLRVEHLHRHRICQNLWHPYWQIAHLFAHNYFPCSHCNWALLALYLWKAVVLESWVTYVLQIISGCVHSVLRDILRTHVHHFVLVLVKNNSHCGIMIPMVFMISMKSSESKDIFCLILAKFSTNAKKYKSSPPRRKPSWRWLILSLAWKWLCSKVQQWHPHVLGVCTSGRATAQISIERRRRHLDYPNFPN